MIRRRTHASILAALVMAAGVLGGSGAADLVSAGRALQVGTPVRGGHAGEAERRGHHPAVHGHGLASMDADAIQAILPGSPTVLRLAVEENRGPTGRLGRAPGFRSAIRSHPRPANATRVLLRVADLRHRDVSTHLALARSGLLSRRSTAPPLVPTA